MDANFDDILSNLSDLEHQLADDQKTLSRDQRSTNQIPAERSAQPSANQKAECHSNSNSNFSQSTGSRFKSGESCSVYKDYTKIQSRSPCRRANSMSIRQSTSSGAAVTLSGATVTSSGVTVTSCGSAITSSDESVMSQCHSDFEAARLDIALNELSIMIGDITDLSFSSEVKKAANGVKNTDFASTNERDFDNFEHLNNSPISDLDMIDFSSLHIDESTNCLSISKHYTAGQRCRSDFTTGFDRFVGGKSAQNDSAFDDSASILSSDGSRLSVGGSSRSSGSSSCDREARRGVTSEVKKEEPKTQVTVYSA